MKSGQIPAGFEVAGAVFITLLGSLLHFTYEASGGFWPVGVFSAMNESVFEHLKLAFWPGLLWTVFLRMVRPAAFPGYWPARAAALTLPPILIAAGFYAYTAVLDRNVLALDIGLFVVSVAVGQFAAILVSGAGRKRTALALAALGLIAVETLAFATLSFYPPDLPLFADPADAGVH